MPEPLSRPAVAVDPITLEIIRGSLASTIRDMELLMERCAMSPFIKEKKDYFVGVFDTRGRIVACHISGSGPGMIDAILRAYPLESMRPGDVYWFNDPYLSDGAVQHHQDMVFVMPVFHEGAVVAFATTFGHYQDIGGLRAGSISPHATEIYHEGLLVPPVRIMQEGRLNEEAYRIFLRNSRLPDLVEGDTRAMMASCRLAEGRLAELFERYGGPTVLAAFEAGIAQTAERARALFLDLVPEGAWRFHDYLDSDGGTDSRPHRIELALDRRGDHVRLDGSASDDQARGPINFMTNPGLLRIAFGRYLQSLDPDLEVNEGLLRNLDEWVAREGSLLKPRFPAPLGMRANTRFRVMSCIFGALAQANGGRVPAGSPVYVLYYFARGTRRPDAPSSASRAWAWGSARARSRTASTSSTTSPRKTTRWSTWSATSPCAWSATSRAPTRAVPASTAAAPGSSATCACSARRPSWPRAWRTRWWRPTAWPAAARDAPAVSCSIRARRKSASCPPSATASRSSAATSCAWRPAAGAAGAIPSPASRSASSRTWRAVS
jgi:N-methylhydantoinase B